MEEYQYHDYVTSFLKELRIKFDFEAVQRVSMLGEKVVGIDFFVNKSRTSF